MEMKKLFSFLKQESFTNVTQLTMNRIIYNLVPCNFIDLRILNILTQIDIYNEQ